jgi:hypothetical protein
MLEAVKDGKDGVDGWLPDHRRRETSRLGLSRPQREFALLRSAGVQLSNFEAANRLLIEIPMARFTSKHLDLNHFQIITQSPAQSSESSKRGRFIEHAELQSKKSPTPSA